MNALAFARFTVAFFTPGTPRNAFSTAWTHLSQVRPKTPISIPQTGSLTMPTLLIEHPVGVTCGHYRHILLLPGREAITVCGNRCLPAQLALDSLCEGLRWPRITVHDEEPFRRPAGGAQPAHEPVRVGVGRETVNGLDVGSYGDVLPEDPHGLRPLLGASPAGADGLVPGQQHRGTRVGEAKLEVVEHAPPRGHPAG